MTNEIDSTALSGTLHEIASAYSNIPGELIEAKPFGSGHINDTIRLTYSLNGGSKRYVLQRINTSIFRSPEKLMENMVNVTSFLRKKIVASGGDPERETLTVIPAVSGKPYCVTSDGCFWRITCFIENAVSYDNVTRPEDLYMTGKAFGNFQYQLSDYPADTLYDTLPGFHDTRARYKRFVETVKSDRFGRAKSCRKEIDFILEREKLACFSMNNLDSGALPLRVTHNDTKINNLMIDNDTGRAICVIDLDTVMPGLAMTDFGDGIRSGTCTAAEDESDISKVECSLELYEAFTRGFIAGCRGGLTEYEIETLPMGALGITYEQALRFLDDYLNGDTYYKTEYPEHNLIRTRTQIKMVRELESKQNGIHAIVKACNELR